MAASSSGFGIRGIRLAENARYGGSKGWFYTFVRGAVVVEQANYDIRFNCVCHG